MTYSLDPVQLAIGAVALLVGLWLGLLLRGGAKRKAIVLDDRLRQMTAERDGFAKDNQRLTGELATAQGQLRPLGEELDKLRRQAARQRALDDGAVLDEPAPLGLMDDRQMTVTRLKGVGERFAAALAKAGITSIAQIAAWTPADAQVIDSQIEPAFRGRINTDRLVEQAQLLHANRVTEYEARFGTL